MGADPEAVDRDLVEEGENSEPSFFADPKRIAETIIVVLVLVGAIYVLLPKIVGIQGAVAKLGDATVLGGRRGRHRAHVLGAPQGGYAPPPDGMPDGGVPRPSLRRLHGGAG